MSTFIYFFILWLTRVKFETIALTLPVEFPDCLPLNSDSQTYRSNNRTFFPPLARHWSSIYYHHLLFPYCIFHRTYLPSCLSLSTCPPFISRHVYLPALHHWTAVKICQKNPFPSRFQSLKSNHTLSKTLAPTLASHTQYTHQLSLIFMAFIPRPHRRTRPLWKYLWIPEPGKKSLLPVFHGKFIFRSLSTRINPSSLLGGLFLSLPTRARRPVLFSSTY